MGGVEWAELRYGPGCFWPLVKSWVYNWIGPTELTLLSKGEPAVNGYVALLQGQGFDLVKEEDPRLKSYVSTADHDGSLLYSIYRVLVSRRLELRVDDGAGGTYHFRHEMLLVDTCTCSHRWW